MHVFMNVYFAYLFKRKLRNFSCKKNERCVHYWQYCNADIAIVRTGNKLLPVSNYINGKILELRNSL